MDTKKKQVKLYKFHMLLCDECLMKLENLNYFKLATPREEILKQEYFEGECDLCKNKKQLEEVKPIEYLPL